MFAPGLDTLARNQTAALYLFILRPPSPQEQPSLLDARSSFFFFCPPPTPPNPSQPARSSRVVSRSDRGGRWNDRISLSAGSLVSLLLAFHHPTSSLPGPCMQLLLLLPPLPHTHRVPNLTLALRLLQKYWQLLRSHREWYLCFFALTQETFLFPSSVWSGLVLRFDNRHKLKKPSPLSLPLADNNAKKWKCLHPHYLESAQMLRIKAVKKRRKKNTGTVQKERCIIKNCGWVKHSDRSVLLFF